MAKKSLDTLVNKVLFSDVVSHVGTVVPSLAKQEPIEASVPEGFTFRTGTLSGMTAQRIVDVIHCENLEHTEEAIRAVMEHDDLVKADVQTLVLGIARLAKTADDTLRQKVAPVVESMIADTTLRAKAVLTGESPVVDVAVEVFDWGCLADPIYVNAALSTCLDVANVFRPDLTTRPFYKDACASRVGNYKTTGVSQEDVAAFEAFLTEAAVDLTDAQKKMATKAYPFTEVRQVFTEANASRKPRDVISAMKAVTECVALIGMLKDLEVDGKTLPSGVKANLESMETACHLMSGAFQTRRELEFSNALYMGASIGDTAATVFVNADVCPEFSEESFSAEDFGIVGQYFFHKKSANRDTSLSAESFKTLLENAKPVVEAFSEKAKLDARVNENAAFGGAMTTVMRKKAAEFKDARLSIESMADMEVGIRKLKSDMTRASNPVPMSDGFVRFLSNTVSTPALKTFYTTLSGEFAKPDAADNVDAAYARTVARFAETVLRQF